jgi:REP element-mobilizing transposase RayT
VTYDSTHHHRRSVRLQGYDYSQAGAYFLTVCVRNRACVLSGIQEGVIRLSPVGEVAAFCWESIPDHFPSAALDAFVVMPNHLHGIVVLLKPVALEQCTACRAPTTEAGFREGFGSPVKGSIPTIVRSFKAAVTKAINDDPGRGTACRALVADRLGPLPPGRIPSIWQSSYYEHVIRNERSLNQLRDYISANPARWIEDSLHPAAQDPQRV